MKIHILGRFICILLIAFTLITWCAVILDDGDSSFDILCSNTDLFPCIRIVEEPASRSEVFYELANEQSHFESIISYLARHEKSPPGLQASIAFS